MGTTLTAGYSFADDLFVFHVGDSRAYLFRDGKLTQLTHDHTVAQSLADEGIVSQDEVPNLHLRRVLTRAIGIHDGHVDVEIHHLKLASGDIVLICSDGLSDSVMADQIQTVLQAKSTAQQKCEALIDLAMDAGGKDNITVVIGQYKF